MPPGRLAKSPKRASRGGGFSAEFSEVAAPPSFVDRGSGPSIYSPSDRSAPNDILQKIWDRGHEPCYLACRVWAVNQLDTEAMKAVVVFRIWLIFRPREEALAFLPSQPLRGCESMRISSDEEVWKDIEGRKVLPRLGIENGKDDTKETHHEKELWLLADDDAKSIYTDGGVEEPLWKSFPPLPLIDEAIPKRNSDRERTIAVLTYQIEATNVHLDWKLRDFPFDTQQLKVKLFLPKKHKDKMYEFVCDKELRLPSEGIWPKGISYKRRPEDPTDSDGLGILEIKEEAKRTIGVEWEFDDAGSTLEVDEESHKNHQSAATLSLGLKRKPGFYLVKYVYRPGTIATLACVSTFIPTNEIGNQLALTFTILLTLAGINYTAAESLPALPYSTKLDRYHEACHYLVYSVICHNVIFFLIEIKDPRIVNLVNWALRMLFQADCDSCKKAAAAASCTASSDCATTEMPAEVASVGTSSAAYMAADAARALNSTCSACEGAHVLVKKYFIDDFAMFLIVCMWLLWNLRWSWRRRVAKKSEPDAATHGLHQFHRNALHQNVPGTSAVPGTNPARAATSPARDQHLHRGDQHLQRVAFSTSSDMGASVAQTQRSAHADYSHYFAESDGRDAQGLEGDASASVLQLPHGVELRSSSRSRGGPLRADMFSVELIPSDHPLAAGALSETLHIKVVHTATAAAGTAADDDDVPSPLLLRMPHRASAEQLEQLAFYRAETPDSEMQLVEGGCFWSDGYAEVEVTSFSVWMIAPLLLVATVSYAAAALAAARQQFAAAQAAQEQLAAAAARVQAAQEQLAEAKEKLKQAESTRTYIDRPVGVVAFAPSDPEAPRFLRFVLHPAHEDLSAYTIHGFCKVGEDKEVAVRRGKAVTITLKDLPELGVTFAPWWNTRQSELIPRVVELEPSSSHLMAVISQPWVVPDQRPFLLMLPTAAAAVPEASQASRASSAQLSFSLSRASSAQSSFSPSQDSSAHHAQLFQDTWDAERPRLVEVPSLVGAAPNPEFEHVASLLAKGLPGASILGLKRVQNAQLWKDYSGECRKIALKNGGQGNERELWHSTGNTPAEKVCMSELGFDPTYSIGTALRASGTDGNKYGIGVYFAEHALYSDVMRPSVAQEGGKEIVLAKVVLGNIKDFDRELAPDLLREPSGFDSWTGTENNLIGVTEIEAVLSSGSPSAKRAAQLLVDEGHKYGRQYIVCRYQKAYPAYVVRYEVLQDGAAAVGTLRRSGLRGRCRG